MNGLYFLPDTFDSVDVLFLFRIGTHGVHFFDLNMRSFFAIPRTGTVWVSASESESAIGSKDRLTLLCRKLNCGHDAHVGKDEEMSYLNPSPALFWRICWVLFSAAIELCLAFW